VVDRTEPVILTLLGNAHPDLAGCLLTFTNRLKPIPHSGLDSLHPIQTGTIGDLTAARKVREFEVPLEEAMAMIRRKEKPPEHMANCLYLEWFSDANGRVVIESTHYRLTISNLEWRLTPEEDDQREKEAAAGLTGFMHFNKTLNAAQPLDKSSVFFKGLTQQMGQIQTLGEPQSIGRAMVFPAKFETSALDMRITLDDRGLIAGLTFAPHAPTN